MSETESAPLQPVSRIGSTPTSDDDSSRTDLELDTSADQPETELEYLNPPRVAAAVRAHHTEFLACQALADLEARRGPGSVTVGWLVEANGRVAGVHLGPSSFESDRVNQCVLSVAKGMSFPASLIRTQVSWTVRFQGVTSGPLAEAGPGL